MLPKLIVTSGMHPHEKLIHQFYSAFQRRDHAAMNSCYHPDATFRDEVFELRKKDIYAMWHMLCERGKDLEITYSEVEADDQKGKAHWEAVYTFSQTGRKVHNKIDAEFEFRDGKIIRHTDRFSFRKWSAMALGPIGVLLGWSSFLKAKVRNTAGRSLKAFIHSHPDYQSP